MALTVEWTGLLQAVTFGQGNGGVWFNEDQPVAGVGALIPKNQDTNLDHDDGFYAGTDRQPMRMLTCALRVLGTSPSDTMDKFEALAVAFENSGSTDKTFELWLPGKHFSVSGRPNGCVEDLSRLKSSRIDCVGSFRAYPTMTAL